MLVAGRVPARVRRRRACAWAHIDVAGPAYNNGRPWGYTPKGATAVPLRAILATLEDIAERRLTGSRRALRECQDGFKQRSGGDRPRSGETS